MSRRHGIGIVWIALCIAVASVAWAHWPEPICQEGECSLATCIDDYDCTEPCPCELADDGVERCGG